MGFYRKFFVFPRRLEKFVNIFLIVAICAMIYFSTRNLTDIANYNLKQRHAKDISKMNLNIENEINEPLDGNELHVIPDYSKKRSGDGENGEAVILTSEEQALGEQEMKVWFMNMQANNKVSLDRSLVDNRLPECKIIEYDISSLPKASVVIIFTDEAWAPLLRTVHSVINRSPKELLHEIVLYDDFSQRDELKDKLEHYIKRFGGVVKLYRATERMGLIKAKVNGAKLATGEVLFFLDSHCEASPGFLEPILQRIKDNRKSIVCPLIDHINAKDMRYSGAGGVSSVGSFHWSLHFTWDPVQKEVSDKLEYVTSPVPSPTMAGGLFAANREYFFEIGAYDELQEIWGGENLELSFRTWMCGGRLEFIPCSKVGHIFRDGHPYNMTGKNENKDVHGTNSKRLAEVWMDEYKEYYYKHRNDLRTKDVGDLSERHALRKNLNCKNFKWYLDNVIPWKFVPHERNVFYGSVQNERKSLCLDSLQRKEDEYLNLGVFSCQHESSTELFTLTDKGVFRREESCLDSVERKGKTYVRMRNCPHNIQKWSLINNSIKNLKVNLCLDFEDLQSGHDIELKTCDSVKESQIIKITNVKFP